MNALKPFLLGACLLFFAMSGHAHIASNGFLSLKTDGAKLQGSLELALRDAELAVGVDVDHDSKVTWGELRGQQALLQSYVRTHLEFSNDKEICALNFQPLKINARVDGNYAWLPFEAHCGADGASLVIRYRLLDGIDPSHRGLLTFISGGVAQTAVLDSSRPQPFFLGHASRTRAFFQYLQAGIWHILSGIDHLLFLLSLLLPAVLMRRQGEWQSVSNGRAAFINILKVVTAFTLAHSVTLSLAAFDVIRLPSRLTESVIAASIIVAAVNNIFPLVTEARARIAFAFGLLHGFGFASVLADMGLPSGARLLSLVAFNLGIELGQLWVVIAVMPAVYALRNTVIYRRAVLPWGSVAIAGLALVWFVQRAFLPV